MPDPIRLSVLGYGMWTAAGHDGPSSVAAVHAGVAAAVESRLWDRTAGAELNVFQVSGHQWWQGETFLPEMAAEAVRQCHPQLTALGVEDVTTVPILIAVAPKDRPARTDSLEQALMAGLKARLGYPLPDGSGIVAGGRTAISALLRNAAGQLKKHPYQIVLGVESFLDQTIVDRYMDRGRILCAANSSGFIPGEAAAAIIIGAARDEPGQFVLSGVGEDHEPDAKDLDPETAPAGTGLTRAMRTALGASGAELYEIAVQMGDLNGEHGKFKEAAIAIIRLDRLPPEGKDRRPQETLQHLNVIETTGEIGAALMPAAIGTAFETAKAGALPLNKVLFHAGEDDGSRIAIVGEYLT